jgi:prophage tail gpP-like protein
MSGTLPPQSFNPDEICQLSAGGALYHDWESVWVQQRWAESFHRFRFTAAERGNLPDSWADLRQFKPGDPCTIQLADQLAFTGFITTRQVAYDAGSHQVQLMGKSMTAGPAKSTAYTKSGNFDGMPFVKVAEKVLEPYGGASIIEVVGTPDPTPFVQLQNQPGEKIWDFLERIARPRGIVLGSNKYGKFLIIGPHNGNVGPSLIEGQNIKACQCLIQNDNVFNLYGAIVQDGGTDDHNGAQASPPPAWCPGSANDKSCLITPMEQPVRTPQELLSHVKNIAVWHEGYIIQVNITVQGWIAPNGSIWNPGDKVFVKSPMAMLSQYMKIMSATFIQDNQSGTQTVLELVRPTLLRDTEFGAIVGANVGNPTMTQPTNVPDTGRSSSAP